MTRGLLAPACLISATAIAYAQQRPDVSSNWMLNGGKTTFGEWHLTEAKWINPHSRFRIDVKQDDGKTVAWLVEMGAVNRCCLRTAVLKDGTRLTP
jgi:hypothetical protein